MNRLFSDLTSVSYGLPQGWVLSPLLYILFTKDCTRKFQNHCNLKFTDDTVIVSLLTNDKLSHGPAVDEFLKSWSDSFL